MGDTFHLAPLNSNILYQILKPGNIGTVLSQICFLMHTFEHTDPCRFIPCVTSCNPCHNYATETALAPFCCSLTKYTWYPLSNSVTTSQFSFSRFCYSYVCKMFTVTLKHPNTLLRWVFTTIIPSRSVHVVHSVVYPSSALLGIKPRASSNIASSFIFASFYHHSLFLFYLFFDNFTCVHTDKSIPNPPVTSCCRSPTRFSTTFIVLEFFLTPLSLLSASPWDVCWLWWLCLGMVAITTTVVSRRQHFTGLTPSSSSVLSISSSSGACGGLSIEGWTLSNPFSALWLRVTLCINFCCWVNLDKSALFHRDIPSYFSRPPFLTTVGFGCDPLPVDFSL